MLLYWRALQVFGKFSMCSGTDEYKHIIWVRSQTSEQSEDSGKVVFVGIFGELGMILLLFFTNLRLLKQLLCPSIQNNLL